MTVTGGKPKYLYWDKDMAEGHFVQRKDRKRTGGRRLHAWAKVLPEDRKDEFVPHSEHTPCPMIHVYSCLPTITAHFFCKPLTFNSYTFRRLSSHLQGAPHCFVEHIEITQTPKRVGVKSDWLTKNVHYLVVKKKVTLCLGYTNQSVNAV